MHSQLCKPHMLLPHLRTRLLLLLLLLLLYMLGAGGLARFLQFLRLALLCRCSSAHQGSGKKASRHRGLPGNGKG